MEIIFEKDLVIEFGYPVSPILEQVKNCGYWMSEDVADKKGIQETVDAITALSVDGWLMDSEAHKARARVMKWVVANSYKIKED